LFFPLFGILFACPEFISGYQDKKKVQSLSQQHHLPHLIELTRLHAVEVDATRQIGCIKVHIK
jgi:hypothetical protein